MLNSTLLKILLFPLYLIYVFLVNLRNFLYSAGYLKSKKLGKKVISVGNITAGGTGKTPFTITLAELIINEFGLKPCVLSRGYKRNNEGEIRVVEEGCSFVKCGDEPLLIKQRLKDKGCVIVGKNRYESAKKFGEQCGCHVYILDDGYQHRKLFRDIDICLIDCSNPFGNGKIIPYGILREPVYELKRADIIVLTRAKYAKNITLLRKTIEKINNSALIFEANLEISHFYQPVRDKIIALEDMQEKKVLSFSAIGNPLSFKADLVTAGLNVVKSFSFRDHVVPSEEKLEKLNAVANELKVDYIVATEKDWVKLKEEKVLEIFGEKLIICVSNMLLSRENDFLKYLEGKLNDKGNS
ncbi:tetraacyldisaccharide 4'-kinase [Thermotomaculum hydrothermale]|uniref:Tetraacyldisaccharide 4'-kinase n=1 Tax=Thermotomaculum hydrothermale TaxID=981385 RepID=A0A7R6SY45_9BACT|nr:tetraacyldisaccharide 4'-kinase [Thermotomaculum hydrothermale]BBB32176.1 tetraacyldisaccharide 4'-kinase [Thermotomaculum hydrothermale]